MAKKQLNQAAINVAVANTLNAAERYQHRLATLAAEVKGHSEKEARPALLLATGKFYGVPTKISEAPRNAGEKVLDSSHKNYEAAKKALQRLMLALFPSNKKPEPVVVPRAALVLMKAARRQYEFKVLRAALAQLEEAEKAAKAK